MWTWRLGDWQCGLGDLVKWTWTYAHQSQLGKLVKQIVPYIGWLVSSFVCAKYATVRDTEHGVHLVELVQCVSKFIALKKLEQQ
jgi:hypothetical protein